MFAQRKKQYGVARPSPPEVGLQWPKDAQGTRSSTVTGQVALAMSMMEEDVSSAVAVLQERKWRFGYAKHFVRNVELCCRDEQTCLNVARRGLEHLHNTFEFIRDGKTMTLREAMTTYTGGFADMKVIKGEGQRMGAYKVPYREAAYPRVSPLIDLTEDTLQKQLEKWVAQGTIEPSARDAIAAVVKHEDWRDLSDRYFVLLGAGSAMGPLQVLLALGANVIAIDLDRDFIWKRLIKLARESAGTLIFPTKKKASELTTDDELARNAGANLFTDIPEICNWLSDLMPKEKFTIGGYAYLDGERHVRVSLAMDAIMSGVAKRRKTETSLAYLCSPTDVFVVDKETRDAAAENYRRKAAPTWLGAVVKLFVKTVRGGAER